MTAGQKCQGEEVWLHGSVGKYLARKTHPVIRDKSVCIHDEIQQLGKKKGALHQKRDTSQQNNSPSETLVSEVDKNTETLGYI